MARKTKKYRGSAHSRRLQRVPTPTPPIAADADLAKDAAAPVSRSRFAASAKAGAPRDWAYEYRYVIADLKRMGITTVAMFLLLFAILIASQFLPR